jgi:FkbM family methyltransferase
MSYSQNNEESVILDLLRQAGFLTEKASAGHFLDIGAYDGKTFSNTLRLAEMGWSGICVEPSPLPFSGLLQVHRGNPNVICVNAAITVEGGWLDFWDAGGDAVSSSNPEHVKKWSAGAGGVKFRNYTLKSVSLEELFNRFGKRFEFINLDVESCNWDLFSNFPWDYLTETAVICVEHDGCAQPMENLVASHGFKKIHMNGENLILARR